MLHSRLLHPSGMAVSLATHLAVLTVGLGYAGVRPFQTKAIEAIAVDIVSQDEVKNISSEPPPKPMPPLEIADLSTRDKPAAANPAPAPPPQPSIQQAMSSAASATPTDTRPAATQQPPGPLWRPPEPDLSIKYQINLGLPALRGSDFDAVAFSAAKVSSDDVAKFRERLKTCSVLPDSIAPTDKVTIRLRASFLPDGTLASAPLLIEASASPKGRLLMQAAIDALAACQPYTALPADKYTEWKVLDLAFTPRDFSGG